MIDANGGPAINISTVALNLTPSRIDSQTSTTFGVNLNAVTGTFTASGTSTINTTSAAATAFRINGSNVASTYNGTITATAGAGVSLTTNTGSTIAFTGTLNLSTGANPAFTATGGGTVTVSGLNNTITSTTGTAMNLNGVSGAMSLRSVSANGAADAITLTSTSVSLTVTGDGTGRANGSGGSISNATSHAGTFTTVSGTVTISSMNISLNTSAIYGMLFDNNSGGTVTANFTGTTFTGVTSSVVQNKALLQFEAGASANVTANVQNSFFNGSRTYGVFATGGGTSIVNVTLNQSGFGTDVNTGAAVDRPGTTITNAPAFGAGITNGSNAQVDYTITNNTFWGADASLGALYALTISGAVTNAGSHLNGTISSNNIGKAGVTGSGCNGNCAGIALLPGVGGTFNATVNGNDIRQVGAQGINFFNSVTGASGTSIGHITNNTLTEPVTGFTTFLRGIVVSAGNSGGSTANWCARVTGNTVSGTWQTANFIRITTLNSTGILTIPGLTPATGATGAQVDTYIEGLNTIGAGNSNATVGGAINAGTCP